MNKNLRIKIVFSTLLLICALASHAQFEVNGVIRPRFEYRDGYKRLKAEDTEPSAFVSQRTRLGFNYKNEKISSRITLFDYRVWGEQVWKKDISSVGVHEAWAELNLTGSSKLRFGRQQLKYDNSRLISPVNWNQVGAAHDALFYRFKASGWELDLGTAWNQDSERNDGTIYDAELAQYYYKNLNVVWLSKKLGDLTLSSLNIIDGYQDTSKVDVLYYRYTTGLKAAYKLGDLQAVARGFYQGGALKNGQKVSAYYFNADVSYKATEKAKVIAGFELLSGNDGLDSLNTTDHAFDILYGGRHKFNGRMDYFNTPASTKGAGLMNPYLKLDWKFSKTTKLLTEYHAFFLQNNYVNNGEGIDKFLGHEIDLTFTRSFTDYLHLSAGYSVMLATKSMEVIKGGSRSELNHWAFVMVNVNPVFFKSK